MNLKEIQERLASISEEIVADGADVVGAGLREP